MCLYKKVEEIVCRSILHRWQTSPIKLQAVLASKGFPEEFAALLHGHNICRRSVCRRGSSFLHSSCALFRGRQVCSPTLQAAAVCKGFPAAKRSLAAEAVSAAEFARRADRTAVCCDSQTCLQCGHTAISCECTRGLPRGIRSLLHIRGRCAAASFLPGSTAGGCCNAVRQRARRPDTADSATALHNTFWHFFVKRQFF